MTTIAISKKHKQFACDGRVTTGIIVCDNDIKINSFCKDGISFNIGFAGAGSCGDSFKEEIEKTSNIQDSLLNMQEVDWECLIYLDGVIYLATDKCRLPCSINSDIFAIGSGASWAMSAMDFGKSPKEAVKYAMTKDYYTGGKITVKGV